MANETELIVDVAIACHANVTDGGKPEKKALKAGERVRMDYAEACDLASRGYVNIPRPQPQPK